MESNEEESSGRGNTGKSGSSPSSGRGRATHAEKTAIPFPKPQRPQGSRATREASLHVPRDIVLSFLCHISSSQLGTCIVPS
jgi:hypothetical protein